MNTQLLQIHGVSKQFPGVRALSDVSFTLAAGEAHALVGQNGAGKSTLMKILAGIQAPDEGTITIDGRAVTIDGPRAAQALGISIIHQELSLMPDLTIAENIFIGRERRRGLGLFVDDADLNRRASELFDQLGIALDPRAKAGSLLVAQQQVVEIVKALSFDARILIMDEPTAALTVTEAEALFGLIRRLKDSGTGIVYISHRLEELAAVADRITVLRDGSCVGTMDADSADLREVITMMVGHRVEGELRPPPRPPDPTVVLEVRGVSTKALLKDVSFDLRRGEILGLAGLMGAGRTEVARAVIGADRTTAGDVLLHGRPVAIRRPADAARLGIGYLSEDRKRFGLMLDQDVGFNIMVSSLPRHVTGPGLVRDDRLRLTAGQYVESLRIKTPSLRQRTKNLSGGNQQKIVIARWLARDCDILIVDEPTRGIDVGAREEIYAVLRGLAAEGRSIIVISSDLPEVLRLADRVAVMCEGRLTAVLDNRDADQETVMAYATQLGTSGDEAA